MYANKPSLLQLTALMCRTGMTDVVVCPGSRNAPLALTFAACPDIHCYPVTDERSAGFFAIGLAQKLARPVAVCCTSGSALLNLAPAVAEAFYQQVPLLVVSADRPAAWIGQMDGQTINQPGVFGQMVRKSVDLPDSSTPEGIWHANRLINEALLALTHNGLGPVHINVAINEPLFDFSAPALPDVRVIERTDEASAALTPIALEEWRQSERPMIVVGQQPQNEEVTRLIRALNRDQGCVVLAEHLANLPDGFGVIKNADIVLLVAEGDRFPAAQGEGEASLRPDLVVTLGGHIVSRRIKAFLRRTRPLKHWHVSPDGATPDLFQALSRSVQSDTANVLRSLAATERPKTNDFQRAWQQASHAVDARSETMPLSDFSDLHVMKRFLERLPPGAPFHLANSNPLRNAQLFPLPTDTPVYCNRGVNGIEGALSTAVGFAAQHNGPTFIAIGDLSFFIDQNALWSSRLAPNLRVLLFNNGGGGIFHLLPGLESSEDRDVYVTGAHSLRAEGCARTFGCRYLSANNIDELEAVLLILCDPTPRDTPIILEVRTDATKSATAYRACLKHLSHR